MAKSLIQHMSPALINGIVEKWNGVLDACDDLKGNETLRVHTAMILESTEAHYNRNFDDVFEGIYESINATGYQMGGGTSPGAAFGSTANIDGNMTAAPMLAGGQGYTNDRPGDARVPQIVIPLARRLFPSLIAHRLVGVQPMSGPLGYAFAMRYVYPGSQLSGVPNSQIEAGYNTIQVGYTAGMDETAATAANYANAGFGDGTLTVIGADGRVQTSGTDANNYKKYTAIAGGAAANAGWLAFAGTKAGAVDGAGPEAEFWGIDNTNGDSGQMPMLGMRWERGKVESKTRKLGATWSNEMAEDMRLMQGMDAGAEMIAGITWEIKAEIDRQCLGAMIWTALAANSNGTHYSVWNPATADGRNQYERAGTLYTHICAKAREIAKRSRRGAANNLVTTPLTTAIIERLGDFKLDAAPVKGVNQMANATAGVAESGTLRNGQIAVFTDSYAAGEYVLLGYKGANEYDTGVVYCPYIPLQLMSVPMGSSNFTPRIAVRTRYGMCNTLLNAGDYYQFILIDGLDTAYGASVEANKVFLQYGVKDPQISA